MLSIAPATQKLADGESAVAYLFACYLSLRVSCLCMLCSVCPCCFLCVCACVRVCVRACVRLCPRASCHCILPVTTQSSDQITFAQAC